MLPPREENVSPHDKIAANFAYNLKKDQVNEPARVIGEITAGRFDKLAVHLSDRQDREDFLKQLPPINDLTVRVVVNNKTQAPEGFDDKLSVASPSLKKYGEDLRAKMLYEYARFHLLQAFADVKSEALKQHRGELFEVLSDLNLGLAGIGKTGAYTKDYQPDAGPDRKKRATTVLERDDELFADIMLAVAAQNMSAGRNLRQIWNEILRGNVSLALSNELGGAIMLTKDDLPYRLGKETFDVREATRRVGIATMLKTRDVMERARANTVSVVSEENMMPNEKKQKLERKAEVLRVCIKGSLSRIGVFEKNIKEVSVESPQAVVDLVERIFFDEFDVLFKRVLNDELYINDPMFEKVKNGRDFVKLQGILENAINTIIGLRERIKKVEQAKTEQGKISAATELKAAARTALIVLRTSFSQVNNESIIVKK